MLTPDVQDIDINWQSLGVVANPDHTQTTTYYFALIEGEIIDKVVTEEPARLKDPFTYYINTRTGMKFLKFHNLIRSLYDRSRQKDW